MITLISKEKKQYKGNLHCHSTVSDGKLTPAELKEAHKAQTEKVTLLFKKYI